MQRIPRSGEIYRHFKNKLYQIVTTATHSETGEQMVIYQALYGDYKVYARPLAMFASEVDHKKYPQMTQKYRFERIKQSFADGGEPVCEEEEEAVPETKPKEQKETEPILQVSRTQRPSRDTVNPKLMEFLDTEDLDERYQILLSMRDEITNHMINSMAVVTDVVIPEGDVNDRYEQLKSCLRTKQRYETERPRRR